MSQTRGLTLVGIYCLGLAVCANAFAEKKAIYNPDADARADIAAAVEKAAKENKHVLIQWGANWCGWCYKLHDFFAEDQKAKALLDAGYVVVLVDTDANRPLLAEMAVEPQGIPYLTVLDAAGKKLVDRETGSLETGSRHDPEKVNPFLKQWQPATETAEESVGTADERVAASVAQAGKEGKSVFVSVGAEWCGWCGKLDELLANEAVAPILRKHFVLLKLDQDKVDGTTAFRAANALDRSKGIPWYAALDNTGKVIATSDAKVDGNTGYPARPEEIDWFIEVLKRSAPDMDAADLARVEAEVRRIGKELLGE